MCIPTGLRPRPVSERLAWAQHLLRGGPAPTTPDDGTVSVLRALAGETATGPAVTAVGLDGPVPTDAPLVSILVCTYNRRRWLAEAVESALAQRWPVEVIVVDDGSTDDTVAWLEAEPRVHWVRHATNRGKPAALETGMALVRGEAVLVLDDDDLLLPNSIRVLAQALFADEALVATFGDSVVFDDATGALVDYREATRLPGAWARRAALTVVPALAGATLVRMAAQVELAPGEPGLVLGQDLDHALRLAALGPWQGVPVPVQLRRRHGARRRALGARGPGHSDPRAERARYLASVQPVFDKRWRAARPDRAEAFAWALGLHQRELHEAARDELARWPGPFSAHEARVRGQVGLPGGEPVAPPTAPLLVLDDGDDGALHALLAHLDPSTPVEVVTTSASPALADAQLFWPGLYRVESRLAPRSGLRTLRVTSDPTWQPPPVDSALLPPLPPGDAAVALAAALRWPIPRGLRAIRGVRRHPVAAQCLAARTRPLPQALAPAADVVQALPAWAPGRALAAELCRQAGLHAEAAGLLA